TNGTRALDLSKEAPEVIVGAFLNLNALVKHLSKTSRDILLFCAGWKGKYNLEDSLFAGAVCDGLKKQAELASDATTAAFYLYQAMGKDPYYFISRSNHAQRLTKFGIMKDIEYCSRSNEFDVVPKLKNGELVV
ncbi:MAG TPA: 2-phosphosulfolactate phosphatase, partial [Roseivirga sp.]